MKTIKQLERGCEKPIPNHPQSLVCGEFKELCLGCKIQLSQTKAIKKMIEDCIFIEAELDESQRDLFPNHPKQLLIDKKEIISKIEGGEK